MSLGNGGSLDNAWPHYCLYVAFMVCVDVKIISFQSAAWTFIITYRNEANTPVNIVRRYILWEGCGSRGELGLFLQWIVGGYSFVSIAASCVPGAQQPHLLHTAIPVR